MTSRHKWICAQLGAWPKLRSKTTLVTGTALLFTLSLLQGCASSSLRNKNSGVGSGSASRGGRDVENLERLLRQQRSKIDEMRERNLVLEQRLNQQRRSANGAAAAGDVSSTASASGRNGGPSDRLRSFASDRRGSAVAKEREFAFDPPPVTHGRPDIDVDSVPIPFTPSAADGFDVSLEQMPGNLAEAGPMGGPSPRDLREQRARAVAQESSPMVQVAHPKIANDFAPDPVSAANVEISAHRPGIGVDDLSFALKSKPPSAAASMTTRVLPKGAALPAKRETASQNGRETEPSGEDYLYSKVIASYRAKKSTELSKAMQMLIKSYPDSVFADNAVYLSGLLAYEKGELAQAQGLMERVLREYPQGNKVVSALFAKAMIAKKMRNYAQTRKLLDQVTRIFPGSPEADRVGYEIKILKMAQTGSIHEL